MGRYLDLIRQQREVSPAIDKSTEAVNTTDGTTFVVPSPALWSYDNQLKYIEKRTLVVSVVHSDISAQKTQFAGTVSEAPKKAVSIDAGAAEGHLETLRAWVAALRPLQLAPAHPAADMPQKRWQQFIGDCQAFLNEGWGAKAAQLGWGELDLFGIDRERPYGRIDHLGLVWLINGAKIVDLDRHKATIETRIGSRQTFRRRPFPVEEVVPIWEIAR